MRAFSRVEEGYASRLEAWEREYLAGLADQVAHVLDVGPPAGAVDSGAWGGAGTAGGVRPGPGAGPDREPRAGETTRDADVLASLDFDPDPDPTAPAPSWSTTTPLLEALLPDASEDPQVAVEIASLTRSRLRRDKHARLELVVAELVAPTGQDGAVLVRRGQEQDWLGALNDVRLVLAVRLDIDGPEAAERVHAVAWEQAPQAEDESSRWRRAMALSYDMLTWWQESLISVVLFDEGDA